MSHPQELLLGGLAAVGAGLFTNPLEVVKTRIQLQGELRSRGQYAVHYKNVFHAFYVIGKTEGLRALQKGLVPACYYQFAMNGIRLGIYQSIENAGLTRNSQGDLIFGYTLLAGAFSGAAGATIGSPFYLIKTQLQSQAKSSIAVGHQHQHTSFTGALFTIAKSQGLKGLWRGAPAQLVRVTVGSTAQLTTFTNASAIFNKYSPLKGEGFLNTISSAIFSSSAVVLMMTPFDVVSTRLYNQPVDKVTRKGLMYTGFFDCFQKIFKTEGFFGFYKGVSASYLRVGPHTILTFVFWRQIRKFYLSLKGDNTTNPDHLD